MTTEEFQRIVLEKLGGLEEGQKRLEERQTKLEEGLFKLIDRVDGIEKTVNAIHEETVDLTEFKVETKVDLVNIKSTISRIEIATADNWSDIARLKSIV